MLNAGEPSFVVFLQCNTFFFRRLCEHTLTQRDYTTLVSVLTSKTSCLRELILTNSIIKDAGVRHLCTGLANTQCQLEALR